MKVSCIGAGYIGGPTISVIASHNPESSFVVCDINEDTIKKWNSCSLPIFEPGLNDVVMSARGDNLTFTTDIAKAISDSDVIFIGVNTPTKTFGQGKGIDCNLSFWESAARDIAKYSTNDKIVVNKSTLPVGSGSWLSDFLNKCARPRVKFDVVSNPEFLAEGSAIMNLENPDRIVIGCDDKTDRGLLAARKIASLYGWVDDSNVVIVSRESAELTKLASNAFLAQRVSSINAIAEICEKTGADVSQVSRCVGLDSRIGSGFLKAGPGFGGSCFKKDVLNIASICKKNGLDDACNYWLSVVGMNESHKDRIVKRLSSKLNGTIAGKKIAILGYAFKADTGDTRETPAESVVRSLVEENAVVAISDPKALPNARKDLADISGVIYCNDEYEAVDGADVVIIITDWKCYCYTDWNIVYEKMRKPAIIFDTRNCVGEEALDRIGFFVMKTGK